MTIPIFSVLERDLAFPFQEGEPFQGQKRPDHVFADSLGLIFGLGPYAAVHIETRVAPGKDLIRELGADEFLSEKTREHLPGKEFSKPADIEGPDLMEYSVLNLCPTISI